MTVISSSPAHAASVQVMCHTEAPDLPTWKGATQLGKYHRARSRDGARLDYQLQGAPEASSALPGSMPGPSPFRSCGQRR